MQESGEARLGAGTTRVASEFRPGPVAISTDRLQSAKRRRGPARTVTFEHINATADSFFAEGQPVKKKKELVGNFKNGGRGQPKGTPPAVADFPTDAEGKAIPYGVYDMARNEAWVSVGRDHDTPAFAVASIRHWWQQMGCAPTPGPVHHGGCDIGCAPGSTSFNSWRRPD